MDRHRFVANPDPDSVLYFDADPDPEPTLGFTHVWKVIFYFIFCLNSSACSHCFIFLVSVIRVIILNILE